jgi:hypothetical protein
MSIMYRGRIAPEVLLYFGGSKAVYSPRGLEK